MVGSNDENRPPQPSEESKDREFTSGVRSLGIVQLSSPEHGTYKVGISGEDSWQANIAISGQQSSETIPGKIVSQLIEETQKQLAYHQHQAEILQERLSELKAINTEE